MNACPQQLITHSETYPHQEMAVCRILEKFETEDRTHISMACGTGKTRVSLRVAERLGVNNIVVFLPSLALVNQFMKEWLAITRWSIISSLAICSDTTVTKETDRLLLNPSNCDFPVTTDPQQVTLFLKTSTTGVKIVFCTYHSSEVLSEGMKESAPFALGIFDEAHRTAGNNQFGLALNDAAIPIKKRLFMTATPKHYDVHHRDKMGDAQLMYSMDSETLYGPRAYTLSFRQAIKLGIIVDYKVMISVVNTPKKGNENEDAGLEEKIVALRKALVKDRKIAKTITFHRTIEEAHHFYAHIKKNNSQEQQESQEALPEDLLPLHISSRLSHNERKKIMHSFQTAPKCLITNAQCLTEGIDVPAVDMVAFLNSKHSKIDIIQSIGRAMRLSPNKNYGYVFVPLFVSTEEGENLEDAILRTDYGDVWDVLQALSEQDEDLQTTITRLQQEKGKTGTLLSGLEKYIDIITHDTVNMSLEEHLKKTISIAIVNHLGNCWDKMYGQLQKFNEQHGHCNVPRGYNNKSLASWVNHQRINYNIRKLGQGKIDLLSSLGFDWSPRDTKWDANFKQLKLFKEQHGHCHVPYNYKNTSLGVWVQKQRKSYNKRKLGQGKIDLLTTLGFDWFPIDTQWNENFKQLQLFKDQHGHCHVPKRCENKSFASWVSKQRNNYNKGILGHEKIDLLASLGFDWSPFDTQWDANFKQLQLFKEQYGHSNVTRSYKNKSLARWVQTQRQTYQKNLLSEERVRLLNSLGFAWRAK